jgi:hypothetical protein
MASRIFALERKSLAEILMLIQAQDSRANREDNSVKVLSRSRCGITVQTAFTDRAQSAHHAPLKVDVLSTRAMQLKT